MQNTRLEPVEPYLSKRNRYKPKKGDDITLDLPGERVRAKIMGVANEDMIVVEILTVPIGKAPHGYGKGDIANAKRGMDKLAIEERWNVISERELQQAEARAKFEREEEERQAITEAERVAAIRKRDLAPVPRGTTKRLGARRSNIGRPST